jgi:hypothetical protein
MIDHPPGMVPPDSRSLRERMQAGQQPPIRLGGSPPTADPSPPAEEPPYQPAVRRIPGYARWRLRQHMRAVRADNAALVDAASSMQTYLLDMFLDVLETALVDTGVDPNYWTDVIDRVVYGCVPQWPAAQEHARLLRTMADRLGPGTAP